MFTILETDTRFAAPTTPGEREHCSRCGEPIDEDTVPIRAWPESGAYEYRFHPECLGFQTFDGPEDTEEYSVDDLLEGG